MFCAKIAPCFFIISGVKNSVDRFDYEYSALSHGYKSAVSLNLVADGKLKSAVYFIVFERVLAPVNAHALDRTVCGDDREVFICASADQSAC